MIPEVSSNQVRCQKLLLFLLTNVHVCHYSRTFKRWNFVVTPMPVSTMSKTCALVFLSLFRVFLFFDRFLFLDEKTFEDPLQKYLAPSMVAIENRFRNKELLTKKVWIEVYFCLFTFIGLVQELYSYRLKINVLLGEKMDGESLAVCFGYFCYNNSFLQFSFP